MCEADYVPLYHFFEIQPGMDFRRAPSGIDIRYLRHLERRATGDSALAKEARAFVRNALQDVSLTRPHDKTAAPAMREKAIGYLLKLEGAK